MADIRAEYLIITDGAGWADRSGRGRLRLEGADAAAFLQGLLTNDIKALEPGRGAYAALLTPQGRMVADFRIYRRADALVADVAPGTAADLAARFDSMIFAEDLVVTDITPQTALVSVVGREAADRVARALDLGRSDVEGLEPLAQLEAGAVLVIRADLADVPMFDIWMPAGMRSGLLKQLEEAGVQQVSEALLETLRIEAARPAFGIDMTSATIPLEAGLLDRAISTSKGCYVGQEVVIRVLHRGGGRVARRLVQMVVDATDAVQPGDVVRARAEPASSQTGAAGDAGRVTSCAFSPKHGRMVALGYVPRELAEPGVALAVETSDGAAAAAEVVRLAG
ncbi:MAG TPA: glycine cleavage T C-terminal barrel domain-containing protein [Vicinamibacterales bacterium]|nr:glycine cleavage T C-terminal barrel domain-containing protein [Vicinamibacterales bacterium]